MSPSNDSNILSPKKQHRSFCKGITLKGKPCKNKKFKNKNHCVHHHNKFRLEKPDECSICFEPIDNLKLPLSCGHWIHKKCILKWGKPICPVCRLPITLTSYEKQKLNQQEEEENEYISLPQQVIDLILSSYLYSMPPDIHEDIILGLINGDESILLIREEL